MDQTISSPAICTIRSYVSRSEKYFPAESGKAIYHCEKFIIKEGASQSYIITISHVPQFVIGHEKDQSGTL